MGVLRGSIGYTKFHVRGELPDRFADRFVESLRVRRFRPLTPADEEIERAGWVSVQHPFDVDLDHGKVFANEYLLVGLRIDRVRIPNAVLKAHLEDAAAELLARTGQERLSKSQREDVRAMVTRRLREQFPPAMRVTDLCFDLNRKVVRLFTHATAVADVAIELFERTFTGLTLVHDAAYVRGENLGFSDAQLGTLAALEPTPFHFEPGGRS